MPRKNMLGLINGIHHFPTILKRDHPYVDSSGLLLSTPDLMRVTHRLLCGIQFRQTSGQFARLASALGKMRQCSMIGKKYLAKRV